jgi:hypothetical protein
MILGGFRKQDLFLLEHFRRNRNGFISLGMMPLAPVLELYVFVFMSDWLLCKSGLINLHDPECLCSNKGSSMACSTKSSCIIVLLICCCLFMMCQAFVSNVSHSGTVIYCVCVFVFPVRVVFLNLQRYETFCFLFGRATDV